MASSNVPDNWRLSNLDPQPPFFKLSAELRNGIYGLILPGGIGWKILVSQDTEPNTEPALLQVNKQIRAEAASLYYGSNIFEVTVKADSIYVLADWAASLTRTDLAYVRRLELNFVLEDRHFEQGLDKGLKDTLTELVAAYWALINRGLARSSLRTECRLMKSLSSNETPWIARLKLRHEANSFVSILHMHRCMSGGRLS